MEIMKEWNYKGLLTKVDKNWRYYYFCAKCGLSSEKAKFLKETGYEVRTVHLKCQCGNKYEYYG